MRNNLSKVLFLPAVILSLLLCSCSLGEPKEQIPAPTSGKQSSAAQKQNPENQDMAGKQATVGAQEATGKQETAKQQDSSDKQGAAESKKNSGKQPVAATRELNGGAAAATTKEAEKAKEAASQSECSITLQITYPKEAGLSNVSEKITVAKDQSVLECLVEYGKDSKVPVVYSGAKSSGYVEGINGIFEFDYGPESGWVYSVNGSKPQKSAGAYKMKNGDSVVWSYILKLDEAF